MATPLSDTREDPFTKAISFRPMDVENNDIAEFDNFPGKFGFQLQDRIESGSISVDGTAPVQSFDIVQTAPLPGQVRIDNDTAFCFFNIADNGKNIDCDYNGGGSVSSKKNSAVIVGLGLSTIITAGGSTTTVSVVDVLMASMTFNVGAEGGGNYLLFFSTSISNDANNEEIFFSAYVNGVQVPNSERHWLEPPIVIPVSLSGIGVSPLNSQIVEVRWRTTGGIATAENRNFTLLKVA